MDKPSWIKTCKYLSALLIACIQRKYDELHIVFDRNDIPNHISQRQGICGLVILTLWNITSQTLQIFQFPLKKLLSHTAIKDELTGFLSKELLEFSKETNNTDTQS